MDVMRSRVEKLGEPNLKKFSGRRGGPIKWTQVAFQLEESKSKYFLVIRWGNISRNDISIPEEFQLINFDSKVCYYNHSKMQKPSRMSSRRT
tara:strand:- start:3436 stop:3711 length:276 start_codon:yes stop_codon:yes gene_type:complete